MNPSTPKQEKGRRLSLSNVTILLMSTTLVGQVLGFLRTKLVNANFPPHGIHSTDAYFAAFTVPDFFYFTISAGVLAVALMPVLSDRFNKQGSRSAWELSTSVLNFLAVIMLIVAVIILIFANQLMRYVVAPGLSPAQLHNAADIMRLLAFNPLLFTISGIFASVQQTFGRFFFYAIAPLTYNLSIILSIFIFRHNIGLVGLGIGALVGAFIQLLVIAIGALNSNFSWSPKILWSNKEFKSVIRNLPPRSLDQGMDQLEAIVETHIASGLGAGTITNYANAYTLSTTPILLLGNTISTAAFPRLNLRLSQNRPDLFRKDYRQILRVMVWLTAPVVVISYFCRGYLARLIYTNDNDQIAIIFGFLAAAIFFGVLYSLISRWFYAHKDTKTPLLVSVFTISLNVILAFTLSRPSVYGVAGLAIAQSIVAAVEVLILTIILFIRDRELFDLEFISSLIRIISITGFTIVAGFIMISFFPLGVSEKGFFVLGGRIGLIAAATFGVHLIFSALFGLDEMKPVYRVIKKLIARPVRWTVQ